MLVDYRADDEEAESSSFDTVGDTARNTVEALEDLLQFATGDADPMIDDPDRNLLPLEGREFNLHLDLVEGVLDGIVDQIGDGRAQLLRVSANKGRNFRAQMVNEGERLGRKVHPLAGQLRAVPDEQCEVDWGLAPRSSTMPRLTGSQDLLDGMQEPVVFVEHDAIELLALLLAQLMLLEGFEVEADRGNRGLQFVCDGVDEAVVLLIASDLPDKVDGVEDQSRNDEEEECDSQHQHGNLPPVEDDPADVEGDGEDNQTDPEDGEEIDRFPIARGRHPWHCRE